MTQIGDAVRILAASKPEGKTIGHEEYQFYRTTLDAIIPIAVAFLERGGQVDKFREYLLAEEEKLQAAGSVKGQQSGLIARGINVASLNGEVEVAISEARVHMVVKEWYNVVARKQKCSLYDYISKKFSLPEQAVSLLKPTISRALCRCAGIR